MNSDGWTTVRRGRGVAFPDAAASAFGNRRSGGTQRPRDFTGQRGFDTAATEAFGRKKQSINDNSFKERYAPPPKKAVEPVVKLEIADTTLFPALGGASEGAAPKETSGWGSRSSSSFADVIKARAEADKAEQEARSLEAKRIEDARAREEADLAIHRRSHRRHAKYYGTHPDMEEDMYNSMEDENSLDYRHPYDRSYGAEYSAPMYEDEGDCEDESDHEHDSGYDNSAW